MADAAALREEAGALRTRLAMLSAQEQELVEQVQTKQEAVAALERLALDMHQQMQVASTSSSDLPGQAAAARAGEALEKLRVSIAGGGRESFLARPSVTTIQGGVPRPQTPQSRGSRGPRRRDPEQVAGERIQELQGQVHQLEVETDKQAEELQCLRAEIELARRQEHSINTGTGDGIWNFFGWFKSETAPDGAVSVPAMRWFAALEKTDQEDVLRNSVRPRFHREDSCLSDPDPDAVYRHEVRQAFRSR
mmetsp:Transcript_39329/g.88373  ORF Transcript_39329/g.88373 Transcript_39329/m.88373 type:complete len:250 (+) Transcript_39329:40-789(+)